MEQTAQPEIYKTTQKTHKKWVVFVFFLVACTVVGFVLYIVMHGKKSITDYKNTITPTIAPKQLTPEEKKKLEALQEAYITASASAQGAILSENAGKDVTIQQVLDGKTTTVTVSLVAKDLIIYERSLTQTTNPKILTAGELHVGRYISVSGEKLSTGVLRATVIAVDPQENLQEVPMKKVPRK